MFDNDKNEQFDIKGVETNSFSEKDSLGSWVYENDERKKKVINAGNPDYVLSKNQENEKSNIEELKSNETKVDENNNQDVKSEEKSADNTNEIPNENQSEKVQTEDGQIEIKEQQIKLEPYKVFDCDFEVTDPDYVEYYKTRNKIMILENQLVGNITSKGTYVISNEIKKDLVNMKKEIEDSTDEYFLASIMFMKKNFYFKVEISKIDGGKARAGLYLVENTSYFLKSQYLVSHIADFEDDFDSQFRVKVRKVFNLFDVPQLVQDTEVGELAVRMQSLIDEEILLGGLYNISSQIYIMRMLELLSNYGELGQEIITNYKTLASEVGTEEENYYTILKAMLDRSIDEKGGLEQLTQKKDEVKSIVKEINSTVKKINNVQNKPGAVEAIKTEKAKKEEKKDEKKADKKSAKKPAKKPAKKSAKKADKKKADKGKGKGGAVSVLQMIAISSYMSRSSDKGDSKGGGKESSKEDKPIQVSPPKEEVKEDFKEEVENEELVEEEIAELSLKFEDEFLLSPERFLVNDQVGSPSTEDLKEKVVNNNKILEKNPSQNEMDPFLTLKHIEEERELE